MGNDITPEVAQRAWDDMRAGIEKARASEQDSFYQHANKLVGLFVCLEDGRGFWTKLKDFLKEQVFSVRYIGEGDLDLFQIVNIEEPDLVEKVSGYIRNGVQALEVKV